MLVVVVSNWLIIFVGCHIFFFVKQENLVHFQFLVLILAVSGLSYVVVLVLSHLSGVNGLSLSILGCK